MCGEGDRGLPAMVVEADGEPEHTVELALVAMPETEQRRLGQREITLGFDRECRHDPRVSQGSDDFAASGPVPVGRSGVR